MAPSGASAKVVVWIVVGSANSSGILYISDIDNICLLFIFRFQKVVANEEWCFGIIYSFWSYFKC